MKSNIRFCVFFLLFCVCFSSLILISEQNITESEERGEIFEGISASDTDFPYEYYWHQTWEVPTQSYLKSTGLLVDEQGNAYILVLPRDPEEDIVLIKYNNEGIFQWEQRWGGSEDDCAYDLVMNSQGDIIIAGYTRSYGAGENDIVLICYDDQGNFKWEKFWGSSLSETVSSIVIDEDDNLFLSGDIWDGNDYDLLLIKFDHLGNYEWHIIWGDYSDSERGMDIALADTGHICITGYFYNSTEVYQLLVIVFDNLGNYIWDKIYGTHPIDYKGQGIIVDNESSIYITGYIYGSYNYDTLLLKYNSSGDMLWSRLWGNSNTDLGCDIILDFNENIIIISYCKPFTHYAFALISYDPNGNLRWEYIDEGGGIKNPSNIALDASGNLYTYGNIDYKITYIVKYNHDYIPPVITLISPLNNTIYNSGKEIFVDVIDSHLDTVLYQWDDSEFQFWDSPYTTEFPSGNGIHNLTVFANDTFGCNTSEMFQFVTDDDHDYVPPSIMLIRPSNDTIHTSGTLIEFNITDVNLDTVLYSWDNELPILWNPPYNTTLPIGNGIHSLQVFANDTYNNSLMTMVQFTTRDIDPEIDALIIITDNLWGGNYTWSEAVAEGFCRGSGTIEDPYTIEGHYLNGSISIFNSDEHLIIQNCHFLSVFNGTAAISLLNVGNFQISNCEFYWNYNGLQMEECYFGTISNNIFYNNTNSGVNIHYSTTISIFENLITHNKKGIIMSNSTNNYISGNTIKRNSEMGIYLRYGGYTTVVQNHIEYNQEGIHTEGCYYYDIIDNFINYNDYGIYLRNSYDNWVVGNEFSGNIVDIYEEDSSRNTFEIETIDSFPLEPILAIFISLVVISSIFVIISKKSKKTSEKPRELKEPIKIIEDKLKPVLNIRSSEDKGTTKIIPRMIEESVNKCSFCGEIVELPASFCHQCGQKITVQKPGNLIANYCRYCGSKITREANFCFECGKTVSNR